MYLVMGITGKVGGATAEHLLAHGKEVRALVRNREKTSSWANQGVELVDGDWNDSTAIERALKGVEGGVRHVAGCLGPLARLQRSQGRNCELRRGAHQGSAAAGGSAFVDGCEQDQRAWDDHGLVTSGARFSRPSIPNRICARRWILRNFLYGLQVAQGGMLPVYYNPTNRKSTMVATNDIGAEVATLLTGPAWSGQRAVELGSMVTADEVAEQLGEVLNLDVKAFAVPRAGWAKAFEQFGIPKGHTGPAEEMFEAVNAGWMDLGVEGTEHVAGTTSARDVFVAAQTTVTA